MNRPICQPVFLFIGLMFSGCMTTRQISPNELTLLDERNRPADAKSGGGTAASPQVEDAGKVSPPNNATQGANEARFIAPYPKYLRDLEGNPIDLKRGPGDRGPRIYVRLANDGLVGGDLNTIRVRDGRFIWKPETGSTLEVPLSDVTSAQMDVFDGGKSALLAGGLLLVVGTLITLVTLYAIILSGHRSGRPLRIRGDAVVAAVRESTGWIGVAHPPETSALSLEAREALATAWLNDARDEHASVPAFSRISLTLVALGAPSRLVEWTHRAALEEIEHARRTFALAAAYGGSALGPGPLPELLSETLEPGQGNPEEAIRRLAVESLVDGCLGEGFAAAMAAEALARAQDAAVREALEIIARDEASHAELSWEILAWCLAAGGDDVRGDLLSRLRPLPRKIEVRPVSVRIASELERHGRVGPEIQRRIYQEVRVHVSLRAARMIGERPLQAVEAVEALGEP